MFRGRFWFGGGLWKPKNPHSLEYLKYLHNLLSKNQIVSENNRGLLVETLRSIAEILIWGDQNDSSVFDFFLEKNMLSFFLQIMKQKCGSYVCVQLLQTLNILFENIRNETSLYYLLSNNHVNSIIVHKFDFGDEEVMAYYISFLKTLSLRLNVHTIHFFYNELTNDFPLYTEAIKFFNHPEGMVRIAVRTLTLNIYRVEDAAMLRFIRDKTASPYFSNLVWFIGNHVIELDTCVRNNADHQNQNRLSDLVAEHLDHLHYLNDILCLNIDDLNIVLSEHLLRKLLIPLYVYSLTNHEVPLIYHEERKSISTVVALFLLSQVFLIISHEPLVKTLSAVILSTSLYSVNNTVEEKLKKFGDLKMIDTFSFKTCDNFEKMLPNCYQSQVIGKSDEKKGGVCNKNKNEESEASSCGTEQIQEDQHQDVIKVSLGDVEDNIASKVSSSLEENKSSSIDITTIQDIKFLNITDEEKELRLALENPVTVDSTCAMLQEEYVSDKPFLEPIVRSLYSMENDYTALFALCLLFALTTNQSVSIETLEVVSAFHETHSDETKCKQSFIDHIIDIITLSCQINSKIRLVTLDLAIKLLMHLLVSKSEVLLQNYHLHSIAAAKEQSTALLQNFYKSEDVFLDMFEDENRGNQKMSWKVEWLLMDSNILLPPTGTPMSGIEFCKRLPCGEVERARRAIRVFLLIRELSLFLDNAVESQLPLFNFNNCIQVNNVLDLNNSDLIACTVVWADGQRIRRFLVIDLMQLILVEPDTRKLGWGVAKFVGFLQDIEVSSDKDDSRCLHLTIYRVSVECANGRSPQILLKLIFDDHIRCMAAKQRLTKGRIKARQKKMNKIARLLNIQTAVPSSIIPLNSKLMGIRSDCVVVQSQSSDDQQQMFAMNRVPGFATKLHHDCRPLSEALTKTKPPSNADVSSISHVEEFSGVNESKNEEIPLISLKFSQASSSVESCNVVGSKNSNLLSAMDQISSTDGQECSFSEETSFTEKQKRTSRRKRKVETI